MQPPIPVTVLGGYLGAGKTTLLNHVLRHAGGRRLAVLVNDFGSVSIDADLVEARDGELLGLAGGCVCCSIGSDLMAALAAVRTRVARPDHVLIETSGVALPRPVAAAVGLAEGLAPATCVVLADASTVQAQAADRYVGDLVQGQLRQAQWLLLNKTDLVSAARQAALRAWLAAQAPAARLMATEQGRLAPELLWATAAAPPVAARPPAPWRRAPLAAARRFQRLVFSCDAPVDLDGLAALLHANPPGLARAKGVLRDLDGRAWLLQWAGGRVERTAWRGKAIAAHRLVCIGVAAQWNARDLAARIEALLPTAAPATALP